MQDAQTTIPEDLAAASWDGSMSMCEQTRSSIDPAPLTALRRVQPLVLTFPMWAAGLLLEPGLVEVGDFVALVEKANT